MLVDGDVAVWDRRRILAYLAETYGGGPPRDAASATCRLRGRRLRASTTRGVSGRGAYDRHVSRIRPSRRRRAHDLPPPCVSCVFWQHDRVVTDERRKEAWAESFERRHGAFGRVLHDGARLPGDDPVRARRARSRARSALPGRPARPATPRLVTCTFLEGDDPAGACERLMLEALADLKAPRRGRPSRPSRSATRTRSRPRTASSATTPSSTATSSSASASRRSAASGQVALMRHRPRRPRPGAAACVERARRAAASARCAAPGRPAPA